MPKLSAGDTAWMLASAALVMFMTPGLAFFYGGLVRAKNVLGTVMQSFVALGLVTVLWALIGYTLAFGPDKGGLIGGLRFAGLAGVGAEPSIYAPTVPATTYMVFQLMFAIITPALIAGAFAERMKFSGYLLFIGLWSLVVYAPVAHWVWAAASWERRAWARSTSPAAPWCTRTRVRRRSPRPCTSASGGVTAPRPFLPTTCPW